MMRSNTQNNTQATNALISALLTTLILFKNKATFVGVEIYQFGNFVFVKITAYIPIRASTGMGALAGAFVGGLIAIFVGIEVAIALFPSIATGVNSLTSGSGASLTGTSATLVGQVTLFLGLALLLVVVVFAVQYVRHIRT
jgi:hypothetical protein